MKWIAFNQMTWPSQPSTYLRLTIRTSSCTTHTPVNQETVEYRSHWISSSRQNKSKTTKIHHIQGEGPL